MIDPVQDPTLQTCACGCSAPITPDRRGRPRRFVRGHHNLGRVTHGAARRGKQSSEYTTWEGIHSRCTHRGDTGFKNYGARGVKVCKRWQSYELFLEDMGKKPSPAHSIEREDPNGDYEPGNCRWATRTEQARNKRNTVRLTHKGETRPMAEWAELRGIKYHTLKKRLAKGWSVERALNEAVANA